MKHNMLTILPVNCCEFSPPCGEFDGAHAGDCWLLIMLISSDWSFVKIFIILSVFHYNIEEINMHGIFQLLLQNICVSVFIYELLTTCNDQLSLLT